MKIIGFKKASPTDFVMHYDNGVLKRKGVGLSFWYFSPTSNIVQVPIASSDIPFAFQETTLDFQEVTVQGQLTFRIVDPERVAGILDFTISSEGDYLSEDPGLLAVRLVNTTQTAARSVIRGMTLPAVLTTSDTIIAQIRRLVTEAESIKLLGVEILGLTVAYIRPTPEMARALEAEARESIQRQSDQAIYLRRNAAVEEERRIKESELNTEIAVEAKRRQIQEAKMEAEIAVEEQRTILIDKRVENERKNADSQAYAIERTLEPFRNADWRTLMAISAKGGDPRFAMSLAFQELAQNASKIGQLTLTPELLSSLLDGGNGRHR